MRHQHEWIVSRTGIEGAHVLLTTSDQRFRGMPRVCDGAAQVTPDRRRSDHRRHHHEDMVFPRRVPGAGQARREAGRGVRRAAVCTGFVYACHSPTSLSPRQHRCALVIGSECSRHLDWEDRRPACCSAAAAGAVVLKPSAKPGFFPAA